jgi:thiamine-phosphate pyrophosphorylase
LPEDPPCQLYLISPPSIPEPEGFAAQLGEVLRVGTLAAFQLRLKDTPPETIAEVARRLLPICHAHNTPLLINDFPTIAKAVGADGVHIGQQDGDVVAARTLLGEDAILGVTCHDSKDLAMQAGEAGADYVAFGAFYPTQTKAVQHFPDSTLLAWWRTYAVLPACAIGGITADNLAPLVWAGADFIAVVSAVWAHPEGPVAGVEALHAALQTAHATCPPQAIRTLLDAHHPVE